MQKCVIAALIYAIALATSALAHEDHNKPIGSAIKDVPIFDAHIHYKKPAWLPYPPAAVISLMDKSGVAMGLVSSTPDQGTIQLWHHAPNRIIPELRPYRDRYGPYNWTKAPDVMAYFKGRLEKHKHKGLGEFHLHTLDPADEPLLRKIVALAKSRNIPLHVHSGAAPVELLFRLDPTITIIWAHAGMSEPAEVVEKMMAKYPKLYADTSYRERDILSGEAIDPAWRKVLTRFADRFMIGTDTWVNGQWDRYEELVALNRKWLSFFPRAVAEKIAYKNAEKLFGRKITRDLIGKK